jgi:hypothetical protein
MKRQFGFAALDGAVTGGHTECVRLLLEAGVDKDSQPEVRVVGDQDAGVQFLGDMSNILQVYSDLFANFLVRFLITT